MIHINNGADGGGDALARDLTVHAAGTRMRGVKALNVESRPWIDPFPACPALNLYHIIHLGTMETGAPTRIVRTKQTSTYFLATFSGRGKVLIDGQWRICGPGTACLLPAHTLNAFQAMPGARWKFCWVCYQQPIEKRALAGASSPVTAKYDCAPLHAATIGLLHETQHGAQPGLIQSWIDLIHNYVLRFAQPFEQDDRLRLLWERVAANLLDKWSLARLTKESGYSREHLRRLCRSQLGRSPMHQVTHLRLRRAAELLRKTDLTMDSIAGEVGYQNPFVFSNAFKKWIGWRPSEYRQRKPEDLAHPTRPAFNHGRHQN
jgi:AraC-like DNA-binding protein